MVSVLRERAHQPPTFRPGAHRRHRAFPDPMRGLTDVPEVEGPVQGPG